LFFFLMAQFDHFLLEIEFHCIRETRKAKNKILIYSINIGYLPYSICAFFVDHSFSLMRPAPPLEINPPAELSPFSEGMVTLVFLTFFLMFMLAEKHV